MNEIDHTYWYLNRASGFVAFILLATSVILGLTMTGGALERLLRRYRVYDLHRFTSLLTLAVTVFHIFVVWPDDYVRFSLGGLLLPFASPYEPFFVALGVFAFYLVAVIVLAFYVRHLVSYRAWRLLHYLTFAAFALALAHGAGAGTDTEAAWAQYLYAGAGLLAFNLLVYRALKGSARPGRVAAAPGDRRDRRGEARERRTVHGV
ncbi:MAG TPA: ferric reductase-like transmembrane domain-containing protein [Dehalococcoidia bacterium]|nr:ferric reductase-like transmembrane domain-containing protein [Dehalococcoidia bacterium]